MKKLRVLILGGGPSSEHEISLKTAEMVHKHLDREKYAPILASLTPFLPTEIVPNSELHKI